MLCTLGPQLAAIIRSDTLIAFLIVGGVIGLALALYQRSVESRKFYKCPECGERMRVELMDASRCNSCGAPLRQVSEDA